MPATADLCSLNLLHLTEGNATTRQIAIKQLETIKNCKAVQLLVSLNEIGAKKNPSQPELKGICTRGRNRTGTSLLTQDFESSASTSSATRAEMDGKYKVNLLLIQN